MVSRLILAKHAMPELVAGVPPRHWRLGAAGREGARLLGERLAIYTPDRMVCSDEPKAAETARIAGEVIGLVPQTVAGLHEHQRDNEPFASTDAFQAAVRRVFTEPDTCVYGNESATIARERFGAAVAGVLAANPGRTVVVVAHGTVIALYVAQLVDIDGYQLWKKLGLPSFVVVQPATAMLEHVEGCIQVQQGGKTP